MAGLIFGGKGGHGSSERKKNSCGLTGEMVMLYVRRSALPLRRPNGVGHDGCQDSGGESRAIADQATTPNTMYAGMVFEVLACAVHSLLAMARTWYTNIF
jgi:hypothetical protein